MRNIYAIIDRLANDLPAGAFALTCFRTDEQAVRYFHDSARAQGSIIGQHPDDYDLIKLGTVEDSGQIEAHVPTTVLTGAALRAAINAQQEATDNA